MKDTAQNRAIMHANEIVPMSENRFLKDEMVAPSLQRETKHIPVLRGALASWRFSVERMPFRGDELTTLYNLAAARWTQRLNRLGFLKAYCLLMHKLLTDGPFQVSWSTPPQQTTSGPFELSPLRLDFVVRVLLIARGAEGTNCFVQRDI